MNKRQYMQKSFDRQRLLNRIEAKPGPFPYVLILDHLKVDFNIGKIIRSAEAFGAQAVDVIGTPFFDPMPAKGCMKRVPWRMCKTFVESYLHWKELGYTFYAFDTKAAVALHEGKLADKAAFILGNEGLGLSFKVDDYPEIQLVKIPQIGKVESLNVAVAASVVMYEYVRSRNFTP